VTESDLKRLVTEALKTGLAQKLVTGNDAVAHWRAGGELPHSEIMLRAADPKLVTPPFDEKNTKESIPSVFIDRDFSGGQKSADAPSRGFGFVEFTHHTHALACLRQLNNNPAYSQEFVAGGKQAAELVRQQQKKGKKSKKAKVDEESGGFVGDDGKVCVPRLIVEFAVSCAMNYMFFLMRHVTNILPYRLRIWSRPGSRQRNCSKRKPTRSNKGLKARRRSQQRRRRKRRAAVHCNEKRNELERRQARKSLS
jgi:RNA recognition motif-containing protein